MGTRTRTTYKPSLIGSSDIRRVKMAERSRKKTHDKYVSFYEGFLKNHLSSETTEVVITENYLCTKFKELKYGGKWNPVHRYRGHLVFMYNDGVLFR